MMPLGPTVLVCMLSLGLTRLPPTRINGAIAANGSAPTRDTRPGQPDYTSVIARLECDLPRLIAENQVPGASMALVDDQTVIWAGGFGFTDRSGKRRITADTPFSIQSISKTYTATAFLRAMDQGRFTLDEPLRKAVPGFGLHSRWGETEVDRITLRHLLSHRAGLCHEAPVGNNFGNWHCSFDEHVRSISDTWLKCRVAERFRYSNLGFDLVGYALQQSAGKAFPQLMREELFNPLGMTASTFDQAEALGYLHRARGHIQQREVPALEVPMLAAGGMYSTARDMAKFISFHLAGGTAHGRRLISADSLRSMYTPQFSRPAQKAGYGLGVNSRPYHGATLLFHGGGGYGYSTDQRWVPDYKIGVATLSNGDGGDNFVADLSDQVLKDMIRAKRGALPPDEPLPWTQEPIITSKSGDLPRLEGTYLVGAQLTGFRLEGDRLHIVRGRRSEPLDAHSPTRFSRGLNLYEFFFDDRGQVREVQNAGDNGVSVFLPNDSQRDQAGPAKPEWQRYLGVYHAMAYGQDDEVRLTLKNGYLYWNDRLKLTEFRPGLFFTADGDSVQIGERTVDYANRRYHRVN
ncbi:MAG: serine hydrolase domain-containing protein [Isosphaeraceae bacterium]